MHIKVEGKGEGEKKEGSRGRCNVDYGKCLAWGNRDGGGGGRMTRARRGGMQKSQDVSQSLQHSALLVLEASKVYSQ